MNRLFLLLLLFALPASAQSLERAREVADLLPASGILRNGVANLHAEGNTLWVGPLLNVTKDGGETWFVADADSLRGRGRLFSIDVEGETVWAGLGFSSATPNGDVPTGGGLLVSGDGGATFSYRSPPLDRVSDTTEPYGIVELPAFPITVAEQSPPYDLDYDPATGTVWAAAWASGIRRSDDGGTTWQRVVLPPDNLEEIRPDAAYNFVLKPKLSGGDQEGNYNHLGFSVLVDEDTVVWAGTARGVNRSLDGGTSWRRFSASGPNRLTGSWVTSIEEQPLAGRNPVWMATWAGPSETGEGGRFGVTVTRDGGESFEQTLVGERVYDFAFHGETVYAAGDRGLFISDDGGQTWRVVRDFYDPAQSGSVVRADVVVYAVAVTDDGTLWVGSSDGLFRSTDGAATWRIFRAEVPLQPEGGDPTTPAVETYAYPNPFSPAADRFVRIRYDAGDGGSATIRLFDFGMNLVRTLTDVRAESGEREATWDGLDENGLRVANGPYFYRVDAGGEPVTGKILVIE